MLTGEAGEPQLLTYYLAQGLTMGSLASVITLLGDLRDEFGLSETQAGLIVGAGARLNLPVGQTFVRK